MDAENAQNMSCFGSRYLRNLRSHSFPVSTLLYHCWSPAVSGLSHTSFPLSVKISFFQKNIKLFPSTFYGEQNNQSIFIGCQSESKSIMENSKKSSKCNDDFKMIKMLKMMKNTLKWGSHYFKLHINCMLTNFDVIFISNCQVNDGATHKQGAMQENF